MPWEHCGQTVADDVGCPSCGLTKAQWSIKFDATRTFKISKKPKAMLNVELVDAEGEPVPGEPLAAVLPDGKPLEARTDDEGRSNSASPQGTYRVAFPRIPAAKLVAPEGAEAAKEGGFRCPTGRKQRFELQGIFLDFDVEAQDEFRPVAGIPWVLDTPEGLDDGTLDETRRVRVFCPPAWVDRQVTLELFSGPLVEVTFEVQAEDGWRDVVGIPYTVELAGGKRREGVLDETRVVKVKTREGQEAEASITLHLEVVTTFHVQGVGGARVAGLPFTAVHPDGKRVAGTVPEDGVVKVGTRVEHRPHIHLELTLPDGHQLVVGADHTDGCCDDDERAAGAAGEAPPPDPADHPLGCGAVAGEG